jgi:hypothetical protein
VAADEDTAVGDVGDVEIDQFARFHVTDSRTGPAPALGRPD